MPARLRLFDDTARAAQAALGARIRERRLALGVSATAAAEAAGVSRVTLHRIEHGEAAVTLGAYQNVLAALGLSLQVVEPASSSSGQAATPARAGAGQPPPEQVGARDGIRLADYPQLRRLAWHLPASMALTPEEALGLYERHWRHLSVQALDDHERQLLDELRRSAGGHLLV